ncbi:MAG: threonine ammonia-lyase [Pseudomonadales bacterium]
MSDPLITLEEIRAAAGRIRGHVIRTPLVPMSGAGVLLKAESLQPSGAFKLRGAFNTLLQLPEAARERGVVAHSSGNHAIAVAMAAGVLGVPATIVMPADAPQVKLAWTRALGARVEIVGPASSERSARAAALAEAHGLSMIEPYDARTVLAATGTITLEILEDLASEQPIELYVPVSGGGLIAGVAAAAKHSRASIRVIGVEPELAADALASRMAGARTSLPGEQMARTLADGLRVQIVGALPWPHIEAFVDELVTVTEAEILETMRRVAFEARLVAEPSGAVPVAAALAGRGGAGGPPARRVAILSGGNVDPDLLARALG